MVSVVSAPQLVGLKRKLARLTATLRLLSRSGTPLTIVGSELVAITRARMGIDVDLGSGDDRAEIEWPGERVTGIDRP